MQAGRFSLCFGKVFVAPLRILSLEPAGEYAKALEGKINDWLSQQGAGLNPEIISIDVKEIGNGFYTAVVAYRRQPAQGQA